MQIIIEDIKLKYDQHRTLIMATLKPNWFERLFIKAQLQYYVGHGTKWETFPDYQPLRPKLQAKLRASEKRWVFIKQHQPQAKFKDMAAQVNKELREQKNAA